MFLAYEIQHLKGQLNPYDDFKYAQSENENIKIMYKVNSQKTYEHFLFYGQARDQLLMSVIQKKKL